MELDGKVAIVTGASRGVGAATAVALAAAGCAVACAARATDANPLPLPGTIDDTVRRITDAGGRAIAVPTNLANDAEVEAMVATTAEQLGPVDILVNNAAITFPGDVDLPMKRFDLIFAVDLRAPLIAIQAVVPSMRARKAGSIINVSSVAALNYFPGLMAYGMAKAAMEHMTVDLAVQLKPDGISVNTFRIDVPVASEGFVANLPGDHPDWEPSEVAAEGILWMIGQPPSYTGHNDGMARLRADHAIMPSRAEHPHTQAVGTVTETHLRPPAYAVKPFAALTPGGQTLRLRHLARNALDEYGLGDARVSLLKRTFNTMFRVVAADGTKYALRVAPRERIHTTETETVEIAWLRALRAETDIHAPLPIADRVGSYLTTAIAPGVPEPRLCVLFEWAPGRPLGEVLTAERMATAGELLAQLHVHGTAFDGGRRQPVIVADNVASFLLPVAIPRDDPVNGTLYAEAIDRAQRGIDALWSNPPHPPHLLHGDLHPDNVLVARNRLMPIDFQDVLWGFEIQDIAMTITALERSADPAGFAHAMQAGYERVRPWPVSDSELLTTLIAARHLSQLNLGFNLRRPGLEAFAARHTAWLRDWMERAR